MKNKQQKEIKLYLSRGMDKETIATLLGIEEREIIRIIGE